MFLFDSHFSHGHRINQTLSDYSRWKAVYDEVKPLVKSKGGKRQTLFRNSADSKEAVVLTEFDDLHKGKQFTHSEELKQAMQRFGVAEAPTIFFLEELENVVL